jgi:hypothetical protein
MHDLDIAAVGRSVVRVAALLENLVLGIGDDYDPIVAIGPVG